MRTGLPLLPLVAACAARPDGDERVAADREDVKHALHRQFDEVLARHAAIEGDGSEAATRERAELEVLANRIAERIVRLDPHADVNVLVRRLKEMR
jgi:hypothetical protein